MKRVIPTLLLLALGLTITIGAGPALADEVADVIKAMKSKDEKASARAFKQALTLLSTEHRDARKLQAAAVRYLKTRKGFIGKADAVVAVGKNGSENALALLVPYLKHKDERLRRYVLEAFARAKPCKAFLGPLEQRAKAEKALTPLRYLVETLAVYGKAYEEAYRPLNRLVSHKQPVIRVMATLRAARPANKALAGTLITCAEREKNLMVRSAAILGLGRMNAKDALPALKAIRAKEAENQDLVGVLDATIDILERPADAKVDDINVAALDLEVKRIEHDALALARKEDPRAAKAGDSAEAAKAKRRSGAGCDGR